MTQIHSGEASQPRDFVARKYKSEIGFVALVTFRKRVQYAWQPLKKWRVFWLFDKSCVQNFVVAVRIAMMEHKQGRR